jgi:hypothetical protein
VADGTAAALGPSGHPALPLSCGRFVSFWPRGRALGGHWLLLRRRAQVHLLWNKHWQQRIGVTLARGRVAVLLAALRGGDSANAMVDENVARREAETMEWSADVGAGSQATAAAEMQRWA